MRQTAPAPEAIKQYRQRANLSQPQAEALVCAGTGTWSQWERGKRAMHPGLWELFLIRTGATQCQKHK